MSLPNDNMDHYLHCAQSNAVTRHWQSQGATTFAAKDFILPLFVLNNEFGCEACPSFPGINLMGTKTLIDYLRPLVSDFGLSAILLFPSLGSNKKLDDAFNKEKNPLLRLAPLLREAFPGLCLIADVCLCTFSETGK